ncbi:ribonuclease HII [soil metagenome]
MPRFPNYYFERQSWDSGRVHVAGVDEAGRGAWAGPIVAAAVILPADPGQRREISLAMNARGVRVNDSKKLPPEEREIVVDALLGSPAIVAVAVAGPDEIDQRGIGYVNAALLREAVRLLRPCPDFVLSDAFDLPDFGRNQLAIVRGDRRSKSIALASCVAKVTRDRLMVALDEEYPGYGFGGHKGYGTAAHRMALAQLGPSPVHRRSFAPIRVLCVEFPGE